MCCFYPDLFIAVFIALFLYAVCGASTFFNWKKQIIHLSVTADLQIKPHTESGKEEGS